MGQEFEIYEEQDGEPVDRFVVRDLRVKTRFAIDNVFYDEFTEVFGPALSMVYVALVRHSNKEQKTWPSQTKIAKQVGLQRKWVGIQLQVLECFQLIKKVRLGKMCTNRYYLIDEKYWRRDFEEMARELEAAVAIKTGQKTSKEVMGTEFPSLMRTGMGKVALSTSHRLALQFASNRKDKQSKDKQEKGTRRSGLTVRKVTESKVPSQPEIIEKGIGSKFSDTYSPKHQAIVREYYD